jgi:LacI family transcriptional regulator
VLVTDVEGPGGAQRVESIAGRVDVVVGHLAPAHHGLVASRVPAVLISDDAVDVVDGVASVRLRYDDAIDAAAAHLAAAGRRRVALLDHAGPGLSGRGRLLQAALERHGLDFAGAVAAPHDDDVSAAVRLLLAADPRPDALLCFNDLRAIGALKHLAAAGVAVPRELAVIGIDGLSLGALVTPELTTLTIDTAELAEHALDLAAALLRGEPAAELRRTVSHTLLLRASA